MSRMRVDRLIILIPIIAKRDDKYGNKWYEKIFYFCVVSFFFAKIFVENKVEQ